MDLAAPQVSPVMTEETLTVGRYHNEFGDEELSPETQTRI